MVTGAITVMGDYWAMGDTAVTRVFMVTGDYWAMGDTAVTQAFMVTGDYGDTEDMAVGILVETGGHVKPSRNIHGRRKKQEMTSKIQIHPLHFAQGFQKCWANRAPAELSGSCVCSAPWADSHAAFLMLHFMTLSANAFPSIC